MPRVPECWETEAIDQTAGVTSLGVGLETAYEALLSPGGTANRTTTSATAAVSTTATIALRPSAQIAAAYTYDADGRLAAETLADGSRAYAYQTAGVTSLGVGLETAYEALLSPGGTANRTTTSANAAVSTTATIALRPAEIAAARLA